MVDNRHCYICIDPICDGTDCPGENHLVILSKVPLEEIFTEEQLAD